MKFIPAGLTRSVSRQILVAKKNSPHIAFGAGIVGFVGTTVLACKATLKLNHVLDEIEYEVEGVKRDHLEGERNKDLAYVYGKGAGNLLRLYAPALALGTVSVVALSGSHIVMTKRNGALTVAYAGLARAYDDYRERVQIEVGEERELDIYHAAREVDVKDEDGKKIKDKVADPNKFSPYARFFDEFNPDWKHNAELNRLRIQCQQNYANHLLHARGHVFLNEVYDMLGMERSQAGQVVGWVRGDEGDNYIDFGMFEARNEDFINGREASILLDFNVDGVIYDKI